MTSPVRGRRYVSARAGTYPPPVPPRPAPVATLAALEPALEDAAFDEPVLSFAAAPEPAPEPVFAAAPAAPVFDAPADPANPRDSIDSIDALFDARPLPDIAVLDEPDLGALTAAPASPAFAPLTGPLRTGDDDLPTALDDGTTTFEEPEAEMAAWAQSALRRILWGAAVGGILGAVAGFVLLALARGSLASLANPVELWASIEDTRMKFSATLVVIVCVLVGVALAARRRPERPV